MLANFGYMKLACLSFLLCTVCLQSGYNKHIFQNVCIPKDCSKAANIYHASPDTIKKWKPDDYFVTDTMLHDTINNDSSRKLRSGNLFSLDHIWFTNKTLHQTLVFEMYTDGHRLAIYHFANNDIPLELIKQLELHISTSKLNNTFDLASLAQKRKDIPGFIKILPHISKRYFATIKSLQLGDTLSKVLTVYGKPDKLSTKNGIEEFEWSFEGDQSYAYNGKPNIKGRMLAKNSFGHQAKMYFRNKRLLAIYLHNDIP